MNSFVEHVAQCWGCDVFDNLFRVVSNAGAVVYTKVSNICFVIFAVLFVFYVIWAVWKTLNPKKPDTAGIYDRYSATLPESYRLYTQRCEARREGIFARALTNTSTGEHLLVVDEEQTPVRFNGYFTGIYIR